MDTASLRELHCDRKMPKMSNIFRGFLSSVNRHVAFQGHCRACCSRVKAARKVLGSLFAPGGHYVFSPSMGCVCRVSHFAASQSHLPSGHMSARSRSRAGGDLIPSQSAAPTSGSTALPQSEKIAHLRFETRAGCNETMVFGTYYAGFDGVKSEVVQAGNVSVR